MVEYLSSKREALSSNPSGIKRTLTYLSWERGKTIGGQFLFAKMPVNHMAHQSSQDAIKCVMKSAAPHF
jgi:hypothetical protein